MTNHGAFIPEPIFETVATGWVADGVADRKLLEAMRKREPDSHYLKIHARAALAVAARNPGFFDGHHLSANGATVVARAAYLTGSDPCRAWIAETIAESPVALATGFSRSKPSGNALGQQARRSVAKALRQVIVPREGPDR